MGRHWQEDPHELAKFAATCGISLADFRTQFEGLVTAEPPPLDIVPLAPARPL